MATIRRFQDLDAWRLARELNGRVYRLSNTGPFAQDRALRDQIRRASISISSNVAEGFERRSPADFARFLTIAKASASEVLSQLYLALDLGYITEHQFDELHRAIDSVSRSIGGLVRYLRSADGRSVREGAATYATDTQATNPELGTPNPEPNT